MHHAVEDRVGERGIAEGLMPVLDRQLTGDQRGAAIMTIFDNLEQVATIFIPEWRQSPVIENKHICLSQGCEHFPLASIPFRARQFVKKSGQTEVERGEAFGELESRRTVAELLSPVSGTVTAINTDLEDTPSLVNDDPHHDGWLLEVDLSDVEELDELIREAAA